LARLPFPQIRRKRIDGFLGIRAPKGIPDEDVWRTVAMFELKNLALKIHSEGDVRGDRTAVCKFAFAGLVPGQSREQLLSRVRVGRIDFLSQVLAATKQKKKHERRHTTAKGRHDNTPGIGVESELPVADTRTEVYALLLAELSTGLRSCRMA
jgi:hypothetical protein